MAASYICDWCGETIEANGPYGHAQFRGTGLCEDFGLVNLPLGEDDLHFHAGTFAERDESCFAQAWRRLVEQCSGAHQRPVTRATQDALNGQALASREAAEAAWWDAGWAVREH